VSPFPHRLAVFTATLATAAVAVGGWLALREGLPDWAPLLVLCVTMSFSSHRDVPLANGVFVSPLPMVAMASVVVFRADNSLLGPLIVGAAAGIYLPSFARERWGWIPFNAAICGFAALAAAAVNAALPQSKSSSVFAALVCVCAAGAAYVLVSWTVLALSYVVEEGRGVRSVLAELAPSGPQVFLPRPPLPLARADGDAADHRSDPHRARDVRVVPARQGSA
jgi:hypothetical protein